MDLYKGMWWLRLKLTGPIDLSAGRFITFQNTTGVVFLYFTTKMQKQMLYKKVENKNIIRYSILLLDYELQLLLLSIRD